MDSKQQKDEQQQRAIVLGVGIFTTVLCVVMLTIHYGFGVDVGGYSRRFGNFNEDIFWLFLVIGVIWTFFAWRSYAKHRPK